MTRLTLSTLGLGQSGGVTKSREVVVIVKVASDSYLIISRSSNNVYWELGLFPAWSSLNTFVNAGERLPGSGTELHYHDCDELWLFPDAHGEIWLDGSVVPMTPNTALYTPMGTLHRYQLFERTAIAAVTTPLERQKRPGHLLVAEISAGAPPRPYYQVGGAPAPTVPGFIVPGQRNTGPFPDRGTRCPLSELRLVTFSPPTATDEAPLTTNEYWLGISGSFRLVASGLNVELGPGDVALLRKGLTRNVYFAEGSRAVLARD